MAWVRIDTGFARHPKLLELTATQRWVHVAAMCWVAENGTDGLIKRPFLDVIAPGAKAAAKALVDAGLWDTDPDGWRIHDWLDYNITAEEAARQKERKIQRQKQWRDKNRTTTTPNTDPPNGGKRDASRDATRDATRNGTRDRLSRARAETRHDTTPSSNEEGRVVVAATPEPELGAQAPPPPEPPAGASAHTWRQWNKARHDPGDGRQTLADLARADENLPAFLKVALERTGVVQANGTPPALTVLPGGEQCGS